MSYESHDATYSFTEMHLGCWIDGALGEDHAVRKMHDILVFDVDPAPDDEHMNDIIAELSEWDPDNSCMVEHTADLLYDATELLQSVTAPDLVWVWDAGDLILMSTVDAENL